MQDKKLVECGRIGRAVGLCGECAVHWSSGSPPVEIGEKLFISKRDDSEYMEYEVAALRRQGRFYVVRFAEVEDRDAAKKFSNAHIFIQEDRLAPLPEGEYYSYQILGLEVFTEEGRALGKLVRIFTAGDNDVYEVLPDGGRKGGEILIPAIQDVILSVDLKAGKIIVRPLEGMLD